MNLSIQENKLFKVNSKWVDVDFLAEKGKVNFLVGPNGAGKSTFINLLKRKRGLLNGLAASFVAQTPLRPLADMYVEDALRVVEEEVPGAAPWSKNPFASALNIEGLLGKNIFSLSGGENQKLKLALALMKPCDVLFLDEPLQNLDSQNQKTIIQIILALAKSITVVVVEHDLHKYGDYPAAVNILDEGGARLRIGRD